MKKITENEAGIKLPLEKRDELNKNVKVKK